MSPETALVLVKASPEVIRQRMRDNPHPRCILKEEDVELVLERFEEQYNLSILRRKFIIDTTDAPVEDSLREFVAGMEPNLTLADRLALLTHERLKPSLPGLKQQARPPAACVRALNAGRRFLVLTAPRLLTNASMPPTTNSPGSYAQLTSPIIHRGCGEECGSFIVLQPAPGTNSSTTPTKSLCKSAKGPPIRPNRVFANSSRIREGNQRDANDHGAFQPWGESANALG